MLFVVNNKKLSHNLQKSTPGLFCWVRLLSSVVGMGIGANWEGLEGILVVGVPCQSTFMMDMGFVGTWQDGRVV